MTGDPVILVDRVAEIYNGRIEKTITELPCEGGIRNVNNSTESTILEIRQWADFFGSMVPDKRLLQKHDLFESAVSETTPVRNGVYHAARGKLARLKITSLILEP